MQIGLEQCDLVSFCVSLEENGWDQARKGTLMFRILGAVGATTLLITSLSAGGAVLAASPTGVGMSTKLQKSFESEAPLLRVAVHHGSKKHTTTTVKNRNTSNINVEHKKNTNVNINKNTNVNVTVRHHEHGWHGARWGAVAFGVTMGAMITVAANAAPYPPDPSLCWTWSNSAHTQGYWYYCSGP
jgi:hypothetical protein